MQRNQQNKSRKKANAIKKIAHHPVNVFLILLTVFFSLSGYFFFKFQEPDLSGDSASPVLGKAIFNSAKEKEYLKVFSIIEQKEKNYGGSEGRNYPDVFQDDGKELTKPEN